MLKKPQGSFKPPSSSGFAKLLLFVAISLLLMMTDHRGQHLQKIRGMLLTVVYPIQWLAAVPARITDSVVDMVGGNQALRDKYAELEAAHWDAMKELARYDALEAENERLRKLLEASSKIAERKLVAELLVVDPEPFSRTIVIAKGADDDVYIGQPVIDASGVIGQVTAVGKWQSIVTLITDPGHAIPVMVNRTGLRANLFGTGASDQLTLPHLPYIVDIQEGDLLISSGMGGRLPFGYPVAEITTIERDPNAAFLNIVAKPKAKLNHSKEVLLIWPDIPERNLIKETIIETK